jgi:DNA-binding LacI/PurR family transcriptional regulator
LRALKKARIATKNEYLVPGGFDIADGTKGIERLMALPTPPTAVVAANDLVAIGAITALKRMGKRVPDDVSIAGYDNIQMSELIDPPITTISQPTYQMGKSAMEAVFHQINDPDSSGRVIHFDLPMIVRQSTSSPLVSPRTKKNDPSP